MRRSIEAIGSGLRARAPTLAEIGIPALIAYIPLLLTQPGVVGADTKTYLYLDPGRLLRQAPFLWDPGIGAGTVTHQNIGYLWPMGPFYWVAEVLGSPDWLAQRLWLGTVLFAAAMGVRFLLRTLGWHGAGVLVASLAYMLSPYVLNYSARISVILLPWAGLGWLIACTIRSARDGGWRWPALFALVVLTVGGINATALVMVAPGPALWLVWATWGTREIRPRQAAGAVWRMGALTLVTSLWWMAGLWAQGRYGLPVLRYTETYRTVAEASTAPEVLRGLGYWFFYGRDKLGPWIEPNVEYTNRTALLALSYLVPLLSLIGAAFARWRHRGFFLALVVLGGLLSVGAHPWDNSSPLGAIFKELTRTDAGLALRSTPRALPLLLLGLAVCLGAGINALTERLPRRTVPIVALVVLVLVANLQPLWSGTMIAQNLQRPEDVPTYWHEVAAHLDQRDHETRALEVPGIDFASYRWGNTVDPVTPGLMDRPYLARELFAYGSPASQSLLIALDRRLHEDVLEADTVASVARLFGAGDVVLRSDLQYERYRTARPRPTWQLLSEAAGLGEPIGFGEPVPNVAGPEQPLIDEIELALDPDLEHPPPVAVFPVLDPLGILRAQTAESPLLLAGDAEGLVDAAEAGILTPGQPIFYAATFADDPEGLERLLDEDADLVVSDTNRARGRRWGALQQNAGYTERAGEEPVTHDPSDNRLEVFADADDRSFTLSEQRGAVTATATGYGNPVTFTPDDRPANAVDGDLRTAWRIGAFSDVVGERLILEFDEPVTTGEVLLVQPVTGIVNRYITRVRLHFDGREGPELALGEASRTPEGELLTFPEETFQHLEIELRDTDIGQLRFYDGISGVGFAAVDIEGITMEEVIRPPVDLLAAAGEGSLQHRLLFLFTRLRSNPAEPVRFDEEPALRRVLELPAPRAFSLSGTARASAHVPDHVIDELIGIPGPGEGGIAVRTSESLPGSLLHRGWFALDGDPTTTWATPFEQQEGHYIEIELPEPITFDHLGLRIVADGRHSVPTTLFVQADGRDDEVTSVELPPIDDHDEPGATEAVRAEFDPITARTIRVAVAGVREVETVDWHSSFDIVMPMGIADVAIPGVELPPLPENFDTGCREDLLSIDGTGIPVRVSGTLEELLERRPLDLVACGDAIELSAGEHLLTTTPGMDAAIDIDQLVLASDAGGTPLPRNRLADQTTRDPPAIEVEHRDTTSFDLRVESAQEPFWLVLGQSHNDGWRAEVEGHGSLGPPVLIDGFANGWYVDPAEVGSDPRITLRWTPQRVVWAGIAVSLLGVLACLVLVVVVGRRGANAGPPDPPLAVAPLRDAFPTATRGTALLLALGMGAFAAANLPPPPLAAVLVAAAGFVALRWRRGSELLILLASASLALAASYYVVQQVRHRFPPSFAWPQQFEAAHLLGLLVLLLLAGQVVLDWVGARRTAASPHPTDATIGETDGAAGPRGGEAQETP